MKLWSQASKTYMTNEVRYFGANVGVFDVKKSFGGTGGYPFWCADYYIKNTILVLGDFYDLIR